MPVLRQILHRLHAGDELGAKRHPAHPRSEAQFRRVIATADHRVARVCGAMGAGCDLMRTIQSRFRLLQIPSPAMERLS